MIGEYLMQSKTTSFTDLSKVHISKDVSKIEYRVQKEVETVGPHFLRVTPIDQQIDFDSDSGSATIHNILDILGDSTVSMINGGSVICQFPMRLNFLILDKLEDYGRSKARGIQRFNYNETTEYMTKHEIKALEYQYKHDKIIRNMRSSIHKDGITHIDIPLLFDFFSYGKDIVIGGLQFANIYIVINRLNTERLLEYVRETCYIIPEYLTIYLNPAERKQLYNHGLQSAMMQCHTYSVDVNPFGHFIVPGQFGVKFIFVEIINKGCGSMPELNNMIIVRKRERERDHSDQLDSSYFYVADYDKNIRLYAISPDQCTDMRGWIKVINEFTGTNYDYADAKQYNGMDGRLTYPPISIEEVIGTFGHSDPNVEIRVHYVTQNVYIQMNGIGAVRYT